MKRVITFVFAVMIAMAVSAQVDFRHVSFKEALAAAQNEGKLVFVDCYTEWCGPCKMMATKEFVKKEAGDYFNAKFVNFKPTFPIIPICPHPSENSIWSLALGVNPMFKSTVPLIWSGLIHSFGFMASGSKCPICAMD